MIPKAENKTRLHKTNAVTEDIITGMFKALPVAALQLRKFAAEHYRGDPKKYAAFIHNYLKNRVQYKKDPTGFQRIKLPARLISDGVNGSAVTGVDSGADCKSFAVFVAGAMSAAGVKNKLKFVGYLPGGKPTHVYNIIEDNKGKKFTFDQTIDNPWRETNYLNGYTMDVEILSEPEFIGNRRRERRQERRQERKERRQERREERKATGKGKIFKKVAIAPARGAMLVLLRLNVRGWASKLVKLGKNKAGEFWTRLGGDVNKLWNVVAEGAKKKPLLGSKINGETVIGYYDEIGEGATLATTLTAAAPVIIALVKFLQQNGVKDAEDTKLSQDAIENGAEPLGEGVEVADPQPGTEEASKGFRDEPGVKKIPDPETVRPGATKFELNPIILVAGAGALFLLMKKK